MIEQRKWNGPRVGLALGAGAARGISHVGVIEVLENKGVPIEVVTGTSMGAIVGAVYLLEGSAAALRDKMNRVFTSAAFREADFESLRRYDENDEDELGFFESMGRVIVRGYKYSLTVTRKSIIDRDVFEGIINELVPDIGIEELPRPFACIALDAVSGRQVFWRAGSLREALWSSSAIPGFFPPLERDGQILVDGGWTNAVPVGPARELGAEKVVAVDISREVEEMITYKRGVSLILRSALLTSKHLRELQLTDADVIIRPDVGMIHWADFEEPDELVQKGRDAALVSLDQVLALEKAKPSFMTQPRLLKQKLMDMLDARPGKGGHSKG